MNRGRRLGTSLPARLDTNRRRTLSINQLSHSGLRRHDRDDTLPLGRPQPDWLAMVQNVPWALLLPDRWSHATRAELVNIPDDGMRLSGRSESEERIHTLWTENCGMHSLAKEGSQFGCKDHANPDCSLTYNGFTPSRSRPETLPRRQAAKWPPRNIPSSSGERRRAPVEEEAQPRLPVSESTGESHPPATNLGAATKVVDLSVEDDDRSSRRIDHRLVTGGTEVLK